MDRYLSCRKIAGNCYYVALDPADEGVMKKIAEHVETAHGIRLTEEMREKSRTTMRRAA